MIRVAFAMGHWCWLCSACKARCDWMPWNEQPTHAEALTAALAHLDQHHPRYELTADAVYVEEPPC